MRQPIILECCPITDPKSDKKSKRDRNDEDSDVDETVEFHEQTCVDEVVVRHLVIILFHLAIVVFWYQITRTDLEVVLPSHTRCHCNEYQHE